tara:strand:+ start:1179 stop:1415 length:237 start_codon:yes stop_codon:yes gene_type:complete
MLVMRLGVPGGIGAHTPAATTSIDNAGLIVSYNHGISPVRGSSEYRGVVGVGFSSNVVGDVTSTCEEGVIVTVVVIPL